jgi:hypothetical protein
MFGKLLALPVRLVNVPARAIEKLVDPDAPKEDRFISAPLESLAEAIEEAADGEGDEEGR